jgi:hypothetical protein
LPEFRQPGLQFSSDVVSFDLQSRHPRLRSDRQRLPRPSRAPADRNRSAVPHDVGDLVGRLAVGIVLHLDSCFYERTIRSLTCAESFAAPLAYAGLCLLLFPSPAILAGIGLRELHQQMTGAARPGRGSRSGAVR